MFYVGSAAPVQRAIGRVDKLARPAHELLARHQVIVNLLGTERVHV